MAYTKKTLEKRLASLKERKVQLTADTSAVTKAALKAYYEAEGSDRVDIKAKTHKTMASYTDGYEQERKGEITCIDFDPDTFDIDKLCIEGDITDEEIEPQFAEYNDISLAETIISQL